MLVFNELRITPDNKKLIIDVSVRAESYYDRVYLDLIVIDTLDTYVNNGPSSKAIYTYTSEGSEKNVRLILEKTDLNIPLNETMFFIYAIAKGTPAPDTPCGLDTYILMNTVVNLYPFYLKSINYLAELNCECLIPKGFIDMTLRLKALELCIKTGNYFLAIKYWKKFFNKIKPSTSNINCNCRNG